MKPFQLGRRNLPRYTSYPTAPQFQDQTDAKQYKSWFKQIKKGQTLSLYIHIPFCRQLCWFCGCHTKVVNQYSPIAHYLKLLKKEIKLAARHTPPVPVTHIHFGGGSPTILTGHDFLGLMDHLIKYFHITNDCDIAVEIDPRSVGLEKIRAYSQAGVTRASLGVQDFDKKVQTSVNRVQSFDHVKAVMVELRRHRIHQINVDLIYGLPHQTKDGFIKTIEKVISLTPERISLFGYAHVPWMKKHQNLIEQDALPTPSERFQMRALSEQLLKIHGYIPIGLDHFAKRDDKLAKAQENGTLKRNFQGYTTDPADAIIGLGISSISSLPKAYGQNTADALTYEKSLKAGKLPISRGIELTNEDLERRQIIMSIMCMLDTQIDPHKYSQEIDELWPFIVLDKITFKDGVLTINERARDELRAIASVFDTYLSKDEEQTNGPRYSQAV